MRFCIEQKANIVQTISALAVLASTAACTTLGSNVSGDFSCKAPGGMCAPLPAIDEAALADIDVRDRFGSVPAGYGKARSPDTGRSGGADR